LASPEASATLGAFTEDRFGHVLRTREWEPKFSFARRHCAYSAFEDASRNRPARSQAPSTGFFIESAPPPTRCRCPLPRTEVRFGTTLPHVAHVPPSWFLTTLTACSTCRSTGLLHPAAGHGVHRVADGRHRCHHVVPRCPTLQSVPLLHQLVLRHRNPMPPCPCPTCVRSSGTSRRSSGQESVVTWSCCQLRALVALLGFPTLDAETSPKARSPSHLSSPSGLPEGRTSGSPDARVAAPEGEVTGRYKARPPRCPPAAAMRLDVLSHAGGLWTVSSMGWTWGSLRGLRCDRRPV
jgi:hypothetical protein